MKFEIKPYVSAGPVRFGMTPDEVRNALNSDVQPSLKSSSDIPADFFTQLGIFVDYKPPGLAQAIEFNGPALPEFQQQQLLERTYGEIERWIRTIDPEVQVLDAGLRTFRFGFDVYAPSVKMGPKRPVKSVIVFDHGYFE
jgi:hypothetical protein